MNDQLYPSAASAEQTEQSTSPAVPIAPEPEQSAPAPEQPALVSGDANNSINSMPNAAPILIMKNW